MTIKITGTNSGQRLDKFLTQYLTRLRLPARTGGQENLSRSQLQKLIKQHNITVNGLPASPHYGLKTGDKINIKEKTSNTEKKIKIKKTEKLFNIKIIDESDEFLIIDKPAGLAAHGLANYTLADWLMKKYPKIKQIGDDPERPGIVHRLDKDVNGLMVIAKTQTAFDNLKKQFQNRTIIKQYTALVYGKIQKQSGSINFPIKRAKDGYKMAAIPLTVKGQTSTLGRRSETNFEIIKKFINYTLLKITIKTGRTHQIRVHLSAYGNPIVGDDIYSTAKTRAQNKKLNLARIFLIADHLSFTDLANNRQNYKINLTEELKNILKIVK